MKEAIEQLIKDYKRSATDENFYSPTQIITQEMKEKKEAEQDIYWQVVSDLEGLLRENQDWENRQWQIFY